MLFLSIAKRALALSLLVITGCASVSLIRPVSSTPVAIAKPAVAPVSKPTLSIPFVELKGSPREMGAEYGRRLRGPIHLLQEKYIDVVLNDPTTRMMAYAGATMFQMKMTPDQRAEITAMAQAAGIDLRKAMLAQCFLDLRSSMGCSTISFPPELAPDGIARMGRNLDFPSLDVADKTSALIIFHPTGKHAFAAISWPGLIGVLSGMNENGLTLANMEIHRETRVPSAMPYTLLYRTLLENCSTVDEAIAMLQKTPRQSTNNLMLMDAAGNRAVVEITPEQVIVRRGEPNSPLISTNHQRGQDTTSTGLCWRYDLMTERTKDAPLASVGVKQIESLLAAVQQEDWTIQSMVFEPGTRTVYLATGKLAANRPYERIDLRKEFLPADGAQIGH